MLFINKLYRNDGRNRPEDCMCGCYDESCNNQYDKGCAIPDRICPIANTTSVTNNIGLKDTFDTAIMSGTDRIMTAHEYAVIIMPACDSLMEKAAAMDVNNPIGMNSDVLKIKAANVIPINGSHCFISSFFIISPSILKTEIIIFLKSKE